MIQLVKIILWKRRNNIEYSKKTEEKSEKIVRFS